MSLARRLFLGFRPTAMILFAMIWISVGLGLMTRPVDYALSTHRLPIEYLPVWMRVALWWFPAVVAVLVALRWPKKDRWGWVILSVPATFRVVSYSLASLLGWVDVTYALSWLVICAILALVATWPEPAKIERVTNVD